MIKQFQEMYFESNFAMTDANRGYRSPDFVAIAQAYGLASVKVNDLKDLDKISGVISSSEPTLVDIDLPDMTYVYPKLVFGRPAREQEPLLDEALLNKIAAIL